ncbi:MAG: VWA-like domain-containing protein [Bacteroidota bacterium]
MSEKETQAVRDLAEEALHMVSVNLPHLAGLAFEVYLHVDDRVQTAGIFASGRLLLNAEWFGRLELADAMFVMAHELMHLALRTHDRSGFQNARMFNVAHDYIINSILKRELELGTVPANGLDWDKDFEAKSAPETYGLEYIVRFLGQKVSATRRSELVQRPHWGAPEGTISPTTSGVLGDLLYDALSGQNRLHEVAPETSRAATSFPGDVLTREIELEWFPDSSETIASRTELMQEIAVETHALQALDKMVREVAGRGNAPGNAHVGYEAVRDMYEPPWQSALQQWMEHTTRAGRTYARPSRRGQHREFVRPGARREGHTLHIVLDTSGSQSSILGECLGVIANFCELLMIPEIHLLQCDTTVQEDRWVNPEELAEFPIRGLGGSDMSAAMHRLGEDPEVQHALVITDGFIRYPEQPMPYNVLWVLTAAYHDFQPNYGAVIPLKPFLD